MKLHKVEVDLNSRESDSNRNLDLSFDVRAKVQSTILELSWLLVDNPEDIQVDYFVGDKTTVFKMSCRKRSLGKILGKKGHIIDGIRNLIKSIGCKYGVRLVIEVKEISDEVRVD